MIESIPIWAMFIGSAVLVVASIELGYRMGHRSHRRSAEEKESPVSAIAGSVLGLLAFMLAFTFGLVSNRYDAKKTLVREEANAIGTAWLRADLLPAGDRAEAQELLREYLELRLEFVQSKKFEADKLALALAESTRIQNRLWGMAIADAPPGPMNPNMAALYLDALNRVFDLGALRKAVGAQARVPASIWFVLSALMVLGMMAVGYQTGVSGSRRSNARVILALSFSLVIALIVELDRPDSGFIRVSQQPQIDLLNDMGGPTSAANLPSPSKHSQ